MALTIKSRFVLLYRKIKKFIVDFDLFLLTGLFASFILMCFMPWSEALIIGLFGYLVFLRLEHTLIKIFARVK